LTLKQSKPRRTSFQLTRYSDLLSVMHSQRDFGKATHPSLQRNPQIARIEPIFGRRIPTVEQIRSNKNNKKPIQTGGTLWRALSRGK
jgi:membrane protein implicated in regulation of membrane protease activity